MPTDPTRNPPPPPPDGSGPIPFPLGYAGYDAGQRGQASPPPPTPDPEGGDPFSAARLAAYALLALGLVQLANSALNAYVLLVAPLDKVLPPAQLAELDRLGWGVETVRGAAVACNGGCGLAIILALLVLFALVRNASRPATILALVLASLLTLIAGFNALGNLASLALPEVRAQRPDGASLALLAAGAGLAAALFVAAVVAVVLLARALAAGSRARLARQFEEAYRRRAEWEARRPGDGV